MADIMIIANPAPPANCMVLRKHKIIGPAEVTSITDKPVVVHPLTDSKSAREKGSLRIAIKGKAETIVTMTQLSRTITPPSLTESETPCSRRNTLHNTSPHRTRPMAGKTNASACGFSSGQLNKSKQGDRITPAASINIIPSDERMAEYCCCKYSGSLIPALISLRR
jgi:hypothetical protein